MRKLLDLFSGAGGAGMGYHRAGFEVVGVDNQPQPRYPFEFHQADAFEYLAEHGHEFSAIHASPPCQAYTRARSFQDRTHVNLIGITRQLLDAIGKPYIIENVPGSPMRPDLILCGSMFGLRWQNLTLYRHRWFESGGGFCLSPFAPATCYHAGPAISIFGHTVLGAAKNGLGYKHPNEREYLGADIGRQVMGIDWMTRDELAEAIPPVYTEWIGRQLLALLPEPLDTLSER